MEREIRLIFPSSRVDESRLLKSASDIKEAGFRLHYKVPDPDEKLPFHAASVEERLADLKDALWNSPSTTLFCARGGYGASDLLPLLDWNALKALPQKWIVGFSDASALHSAFFTKLGWPGIHGPMPCSDLWGKDGRSDIEQLFKMISNPQNMKGTLDLLPLSNKEHAEGWLFGGCLSVLSNLIGTPYFPKSLDGAIVFLEDTDEPPGRILRMINQWVTAGYLRQCSALVLGSFGEDPMYETIPQEIAKRISIPVFTSRNFGHLSPNYPLVIGARASISNRQLHWSYGASKDE